MSLIVTLSVPEGLVIAGDSRLTLSWAHKTPNGEQLHSITASDSNTKVFSINNRFGIGFFGAAEIKGVPISGFINRFIEEKIQARTTIDEMPQLLLDFFGAPHSYPATQFHVVGYLVENGISTPHVYYVNIANRQIQRINLGNNEIRYCAIWGGETEVLSRLLNVVRMHNGQDWMDVPSTPIPWHFMTLQDAIDFSQFAIRTTIETIKFQQKEKTVGGPIDILVIRPNELPEWIARKELKA
jgi:hypothetical protein